jgi:hypothetical protein
MSEGILPRIRRDLDRLHMQRAFDELEQRYLSRTFNDDEVQHVMMLILVGSALKAFDSWQADERRSGNAGP